LDGARARGVPGTGMMIGAGIFVLMGQSAELVGALFPLAFLAGAIVVGFSAYSYLNRHQLKLVGLKKWQI